MNIIHNVIILDKSGSMSGAKYATAIKGIKQELEILKGDENAFYTQTIIEFSNPSSFKLDEIVSPIFEHCFMVPLKNIHSFNEYGSGGGTPLYQVIGETIEKLLRYVNKGEKVLLKVFTDGGENTSKGKYASPAELKKLISKAEEENDFTVTFEGTRFDGEQIANEIGINVSNMSYHDNTAESFAASFNERIRSTLRYSARAATGQSTRGNFYTDSEDKSS